MTSWIVRHQNVELLLQFWLKALHPLLRLAIPKSVTLKYLFCVRLCNQKIVQVKLDELISQTHCFTHSQFLPFFPHLSFLKETGGRRYVYIMFKLCICPQKRIMSNWVVVCFNKSWSHLEMNALRLALKMFRNPSHRGNLSLFEQAIGSILL